MRPGRYRRAQRETNNAETPVSEGHIAFRPYYPDRPRQRSDAIGSAASGVRFEEVPCTYARYCEQPMDWRTRLAGFGSTASLFALMLAAALFTWKAVRSPVVSTTRPLTVMELAPLAAPAEPVREVAPGPQQVESQEARPVVKPDIVIPTPLIRLVPPPLSATETHEPLVEVIDPGPPVPETTAPKNIVALTPASRVSNNAQPNWEGQILAHLERFRRYPARARAARHQGTVLVRFVMNRAGMVLSSQIVQKSGSRDLDQAALDTLQRAQPLPAIPKEKPDSVELTVPVDFQIKR